MSSNANYEKKFVSNREALVKLMKFCAYQERTQNEARQKLFELGIYGCDAEEIIVKLITENFINEERYAKAYASGKFRQNKWGRVKIKAGLKAAGLSEYCIKKGLEQIDADDYDVTLTKLIEAKANSMKGEKIFVKKQKIAQYLLGKGYENDLIWETLNKIN